jgi:hypothetical protein
VIPHLGEMALTMFIVDQADKTLHEAGVIGWTVMTTAGSAEITVRGDAWSNTRARMSYWNL